MRGGHTVIGTGHRGMMNGGQTIIVKKPQISTSSSTMPGVHVSYSGGRGDGPTTGFGTLPAMTPANPVGQGYLPCPSPYPILHAGIHEKTPSGEIYYQGETSWKTCREFNGSPELDLKPNIQPDFGGDQLVNSVPDFGGDLGLNRKRSSELVFGGEPSWSTPPAFTCSLGLNKNPSAELVFRNDTSRKMAPEFMGCHGLNRSSNAEAVFGIDPSRKLAPESMSCHGLNRNPSVGFMFGIDSTWNTGLESVRSHGLNMKRSSESGIGGFDPSWNMAADSMDVSRGMKRKAASTHDVVNAQPNLTSSSWESCLPGPSRLSGSCGKYTTYTDPFEPVRKVPDLLLIPTDPTQHLEKIKAMRRGIPVPINTVVKDFSISGGPVDVAEEGTSDEKRRAYKRYKKNHNLMKAIMTDHIIPPDEVITTERLEILRTQAKGLAEYQAQKEQATIDILEQHAAKLKEIAASEERFNLEMARSTLRVKEEKVLALSDRFYEHLKAMEEVKVQEEAARRATAADSLASLAASISPTPGVKSASPAPVVKPVSVAYSASSASVVKPAPKPRIPSAAYYVACQIPSNNDHALCMGRNIARPVPVAASSVSRSNATKDPEDSDNTPVVQPE